MQDQGLMELAGRMWRMSKR